MRRYCDGCDEPLRRPTISGNRANGLQGGSPLPDADFDWCEPCALVAFTAVSEIKAKRRAGDPR